MQQRRQLLHKKQQLATELEKDERERRAARQDLRNAGRAHALQAERASDVTSCIHRLRHARDWATKLSAHACVQSEVLTGQLALRYVVIALNDESGLGNRLLALISGYLLAILSERALLIHWPTRNQENATVHGISGEKHNMLSLESLFDVESVLPGSLSSTASVLGAAANEPELGNANAPSCTVCGADSALHALMAPWRTQSTVSSCAAT